MHTTVKVLFMRQRWSVTTSILLLLLLVSCASPVAPDQAPAATQSGASTQSSAQIQQVVPSQAPAVTQPDSGKTTVVGRVASKQNGEPLANTPVRLAEVTREGSGAYVLDEAQSPGAITDEQGNFVIANIDVHEYVLVIGEATDTYDIIADDSGKPRVWQTQPGETLDVGELQADLSGAS